jgi:polyphosphate kinase 2 (PPK2 family)
MLETVDLNQSISKGEYARRLVELQLRLRKLAFDLYCKKRLMVVVYEGWDASGKGGNIRRVTEKLDPRGFVVHAIAAPAGDDKTHHYLWRFWRRLPPPDEKQVVIFDRSWYGRVLVERVEGYCQPEDWKRAYREINDFESQLMDSRTALVKFWIHISKQEQLRRFNERRKTAHKQWKITDDDWRNRDKWDAYEAAIEEMLEHTSTRKAPWTVVPGEYKWVARIKCLETLVTRLERKD